MHQPEKLLALLDKYMAQTATEAEQNQLLLMIASGEYDYLLDEHFRSTYHRQDVPGEDLHPQKAQAIISNIRRAEKRTASLLPAVFRKKQRAYWRIAASVLLVAAVAAYWLYPAGKQPASPAVHEQNLLTNTNHSDTAREVRLADGSRVVLQPGAKLRYPARFDAQKREVFLEGEAFFDISRKAEQPFFVYHHKLVTHVLGTSFHVKVNKKSRQVEVTVITGTVQVYEDKNDDPQHDKNIKGVILTPNQKVVYREEEAQFIATLVSAPLPLPSDSLQGLAAPARFAFEDVPLPQVLETLEKSYGIEILVESDKMNNCLFTGDITKHPLYSKLDIICSSVKASYQVVGTKILIKGKGCN